MYVFCYRHHCARKIKTIRDLDGNGQICKGREAENFSLHLAAVAHAAQLLVKFDENKNGKLEVQEQTKYNRALNIERDLQLVDVNDTIGDRNCMPLAELKQSFFPEQPKPFKIGNLLVRSSHEDITILEPAKGLQKAEGALFSFKHDFADDEQIWIARGAVLYPFMFENPPASPAEAWQ